ncbi:MAG TPA: MIP/aquaporin family protein [Acidimicrobiia bacterium]|nr:MIP/aquaporin family protein [Acidimicrobiia bacterium]
MQYTTAQKALAEFIGAFAIVFIGAGAVIATSRFGDGGALVAVALAYGLAVVTMVSAVGHVSRAHFNPAVTIGAFVTGRITLKDAAVYVAAQLAGVTAAAGVLRAAIPKEIWDPFHLGAPQVNPVISTGQGVLIEAILTFFLVWVVFAMTFDRDGAFNKLAGLGVGLVIVMDALMGGPFTGAAMNPARAFGPALVAGFWDNHWVYWIGPIAGGIVAAVVYDLVILRPSDDVAASAAE